MIKNRLLKLESKLSKTKGKVYLMADDDVLANGAERLRDESIVTKDDLLIVITFV